MDMVTKATSDLNHFNNQTDGAGSIFEPSIAHPVSGDEGLTDDPETSGYEREERMPFPSGTRGAGSLIHF